MRHASIRATKVERAVRACLACDLAEVVSLDDAIAYARAAAGGDEATRLRTAIADRRRLAERRRQRARELWLAGDDDLAAWRAEQARYEADMHACRQEEERLPREIDRAALAAAAAHLGDLASVVHHANDDVLRPLVETLGIVVVGGTSVAIRYHAPFAAFLPHPHAHPV